MKHLKFFAALCCVAAVFAACETNRLDDGGPGAETEGSEQIGNYYAVDLGLPSGLKWATCNVGASTPEGYGNYYAWGETKPKSSYSIDNYSFNKAKQCDVLPLNRDAARANWGGQWRMPTEEEWKELLDNCKVLETGTHGILLIGPNDNSIFLPAAGFREFESYVQKDFLGYYWSSSRDDSFSLSAVAFEFAWGDPKISDCNFATGLPVRPVIE